MKKLIIAIFFVSLLLMDLFVGLNTFVYAGADSCTKWMKQPNGCYWRTCVDSKGRQYCQEKCGRYITKVKCR